MGTSPAGVPIYLFRYVWGGPLFVGTMAQELLAIRPQAVTRSPSGFYRVDYDRLDIRMVSLEEDAILADPQALLSRALRPSRQSSQAAAMPRHAFGL